MSARSVAITTALLAVVAAASAPEWPNLLSLRKAANTGVHHFLFFSARRCATEAEGCALGASLGGVAAARAALRAHAASGTSTVFWAGRNFSCESERALALAREAAAESVAAIGVSFADAQAPLVELRTWRRVSGVPWVLSNGQRRDGESPWEPFVDVPLPSGRTARVFAVGFGRHLPRTASLALEDPVPALRRLLTASPPGAVHVVLVSTDRPSLLGALATIPGVHVVFDGEEAAAEPYTADESATGALIGGARGDGKALFRLSFRPSGPFGGWVYSRAFGASMPGAILPDRWAYVSAVELLGAE
jgi:hypothetical protein